MPPRRSSPKNRGGWGYRTTPSIWPKWFDGRAEASISCTRLGRWPRSTSASPPSCARSTRWATTPREREAAAGAPCAWRLRSLAMPPCATARHITSRPLPKGLSEFQQPRMHGHLPLAVHFRVDLAGAALPVKVLPVARAPERIHIHNGKSAVALFRNFDSTDFANIMNKLVHVEDFLPQAAPAVAFESPQDHLPIHRVVRMGCRGPGPDHVGMKDGDQQVYVLRVPGPGLAVHNLFDFLLRGHRVPSPRFPTA